MSKKDLSKTNARPGKSHVIMTVGDIAYWKQRLSQKNTRGVAAINASLQQILKQMFEGTTQPKEPC